jgi:hypothetical protein
LWLRLPDDIEHVSYGGEVTRLGERALARRSDRYCPRMDRYVFDPSWLGEVPPPRRPLLLFDGG